MGACLALVPREVFGKWWWEGALGNRLHWHLSSEAAWQGTSHSRHAMSKNHQLSTWTQKLLFKSQYAKLHCCDPFTMCTKRLLCTGAVLAAYLRRCVCVHPWGIHPSLSPLLPHFCLALCLEPELF